MYPGYINFITQEKEKKEMKRKEKTWSSWMHLFTLLMHPQCIPKTITLALMSVDYLLGEILNGHHIP